MNSKAIQIVISLFSAIAFWFVLMVLSSFSESVPGLNRFFQLLGGNINGYIQALMYAAFLYGTFDLRNNHQFIKGQYGGFNLNLLPTQDQLVITPKEVNDIKLGTIEVEKRGFNFLVSTFIKKACTQYRNDQSVSDTLHVLEAQVNNSKGEIEGNLEMVKYMINAIMSLGFIGTLIGLSAAIGMADLAKTEEGMPKITSSLNFAFDTTLVALFLGLLLNYYYHRYLEDLDTFYARTKSYIIDNLISRIYVPR